MSVLDRYRASWPRVGGLLAMAGAGALALNHDRLSKRQLLSAMNLVALMVHQYEEYEDPGYFPGQFNGGLFHSDRPDRYPLNTNTALIVNVPLAYTFYVLPIAFPRKRWLGLAPVLSGSRRPSDMACSSAGWRRPGTARASSPRSSFTSRSASSTCMRCAKMLRSNVRTSAEPSRT